MQHMKKSLLAVAVLATLSACGGGSSPGSNDAAPTNVAPTAADLSLTGARTWMPLSGSFKVADGNGDSLTISKISEGSTVLSATGGRYTLKTGVLEVSGTNFVFTPMNGDATSFTYTVSDGKLETSAKVDIAAAGHDPLVAQQWHLRNTGQRSYAMSDSLVATWSKYLQMFGGRTKAAADQEAAARIRPFILIPGEDMNVAGAMAQGVTGEGTIAVVVDSGLELRHEDLAANVLPGRSINFIDGVPDVTDPTNLDPYGDHGTSVGGLIAAVGWNGKGGRGVAPNAKLIGMNWLENQTMLGEMLAHGHPGSGIATTDPVAVFNRSYGAALPATVQYSPAEEAMQAYSAQRLRGGLGAVNAKSSGNSFRSVGLSGDFCARNGANSLGLTCHSGLFEPSQNTPYYFAIGANNSDGTRTSYSSSGANLLVSAPAGEFGVWEPAMVTADQTSCLRGYSSFPSFEGLDEQIFPGFSAGYYPFDYPGHADNVQCNYTSMFNGTSSAAPNTSGVVSLILSANPKLSYRDVRDILVKTSTRVTDKALDASGKYTGFNRTVTIKTASGDFLAHPGWVKNAAGFEYNNHFGYGRPDAGKAVAMARTATPLPAAKMGGWTGAGIYGSTKASLAQAVPDNSAVGTTIELTVAEDMTLEGAQFRFAVRNADFGKVVNGRIVQESTAGSDLAIEVTSPAGTRSVVLASRQALVLPALTADFYFMPTYILGDAVFLSNAFYGESAKGVWKIKVLDVGGATITATQPSYFGTRVYSNNATPSVVEGVAMRVFGR
jgi:subtilisin family serine protease